MEASHLEDNGGKYECTVCKSRGNHPRCKGCCVVHYCGAKHQKQDWASHKAACKPIAAARKARAAWEHVPMLPAPASVSTTGITVTMRGSCYTFKAASIKRSNMLIRFCAFPADRPAPSLEQSLDPEAIELWETDSAPSALSDEEAIQVINVRPQLLLRIGHVDLCATLCFYTFEWGL